MEEWHPALDRQEARDRRAGQIPRPQAPSCIRATLGLDRRGTDQWTENSSVYHEATTGDRMGQGEGGYQ